MIRPEGAEKVAILTNKRARNWGNWCKIGDVIGDVGVILEESDKVGL